LLFLVLPAALPVSMAKAAMAIGACTLNLGLVTLACVPPTDCELPATLYSTCTSRMNSGLCDGLTCGPKPANIKPDGTTCSTSQDPDDDDDTMCALRSDGKPAVMQGRCRNKICRREALETCSSKEGGPGYCDPNGPSGPYCTGALECRP